MQSAVLLGGTIFAWSKLLRRCATFGVVRNAVSFCRLCYPKSFNHGVLLRFGRVRRRARVVGVSYRNPSERSMKYLRNFFVFASGLGHRYFCMRQRIITNFSRGMRFPSAVLPACIRSNPRAFYGMLFFMSAAVVARIIVSKMQNNQRIMNIIIKTAGVNAVLTALYVFTISSFLLYTKNI